jgi:hypothetical protein
MDWKDSPGMATTGTNPDGSERTRLDQLPRVASLCGWPTPQEDNGNNAYGHKGTSYSDLPTTAQFAGWPTPQVAQGPNMSENRGTDHGGKRAHTTAQSVEGIMAGWTTPTAHDATGRSETQKEIHGKKHGCACLALDAKTCGWATPRAEDAESCGMRHSRGVADTLSAQAGQDLKSSIAGTEKPAALNPDHSRWLMGFPVEWGCCGATAMQSSRKSPRNSSKRSGKQSPTCAEPPPKRQ